MTGGAGRALLIGGLDSDTLNGDGGDDILVAGTTSHDLDDVALKAILTEWSSGLAYATRVNNLRGGAGVNLQPGVDVFNDASPDMLKGGGDKDWFLFFAPQDSTDRVSPELANGWACGVICPDLHEPLRLKERGSGAATSSPAPRSTGRTPSACTAPAASRSG